MVRRLGLAFLFFILVIPVVLALNTDVNVEGEPNTNFIIRVLASGTNSVVTSLYAKTDGEGNAYANFSSGERVVDFLVLTVEGNQITDEMRFRDYNAGDSISLSLIEEEVGMNKSMNESTNGNESEEENLSDSKTITGKTVSDDLSGGSIPIFVYYVIGGVILVGLVLLFVIRGRGLGFIGGGSRKDGKEARGFKEKLLNTERKLKAAEDEIDDMIKREEDLKEDEEEVEEREEELEEREEELDRER